MTNNDHLLLEALEAFLSTEGFIVKSSDKHLSTVSIIQDFSPDLIILDIALGADRRPTNSRSAYKHGFHRSYSCIIANQTEL